LNAVAKVTRQGRVQRLLCWWSFRRWSVYSMCVYLYCLCVCLSVCHRHQWVWVVNIWLSTNWRLC